MEPNFSQLEVFPAPKADFLSNLLKTEKLPDQTKARGFSCPKSSFPLKSTFYVKQRNYQIKPELEVFPAPIAAFLSNLHSTLNRKITRLNQSQRFFPAPKAVFLQKLLLLEIRDITRSNQNSHSQRFFLPKTVFLSNLHSM